MAPPQVAAIVLNWNGKRDTLECLGTLTRSQTDFPLTVYLVDNASSDGSPQAVASRFPAIKLIQNPRNLGFAGGNNRGISQALKDGASHVILLNNDTTVRDDTVQNLLTAAAGHRFDVASPKIYFSPGREFHRDAYSKTERGRILWYAGGRNDWANVIPSQIGVNEFDHGQFDQAGPTDFATGCCLLVTKEVFAAIGLLDPRFIMYFEDNDFCQRAKKAGFTVGYVPESWLWHKNAGSTGGSGSPKQTRLVNHSRLLFALRHAPLRAKLAIIKHRLLNRHGSY